MPDPLARLLALAELPDPVAATDDLDRAGIDPIPLAAAGLLVEAEPAAAVACDSCGRDHVEPVRWRREGDGPGRPFLLCPADGRVPVDPARLVRRAVDRAALASAVGRAVAAPGGVSGRLADRVWHLGPLAGGWVGWLVAGWRGEAGLTERVPELAHATAAVFVPRALPPAGVWGPSAPPRVIPLSAVFTLSAGGLAVDPDALAAYLGPPDDPPAEPVTVPPSPTGGPQTVPVPPGTRWEEVDIQVDDHHLVVRTAAGEWRVGYEEAGFADGRTGAPNSRWGLLRLFAKSGGVLGTGDDITTKPDLLTRSVSDLRAALRTLTGLASNPFRPTRRGEEYHTRFRIRLANAPPPEAE